MSRNGRKQKTNFSYFQTLLGLEIREKVSRNRRNNKKCLEMGENVFSRFQTLLVLEIREKMLRNRRNGNKCLETGEKVFSHFQTLLGLEIREKVLEGWKVDRRKGVYKQEKWQKVSRNGRKQFLPFIDTFRIQGILQFLLFLDTFGKGCKVGRLEGEKAGRLEGWKDRKKVGRWKDWKVQGFLSFLLFPDTSRKYWKVRMLEFFHISTNSCTI